MVKFMPIRTIASNSNSTLRHSEECSIICSQLDQPVVSSLNNEIVCGIPSVGVLLDMRDNFPLASHVSLTCPSEVYVLMLLRSCAHRFGTLPKVLYIEDYEFQGNQLNVAAAQLSLILKCPPPGFLSSRQGHIERFLAGFTASDLLNSSHDHPVKTKPLLLTEVRQLVEASLQHYEDQILALRRSFKEETQSGNTSQEFDCNPIVEILTLPSSREGTAIVSKSCDVVINHLSYSHPQLAAPSVVGTRVPIRYHPEDVSVAYAFVNQKWVRLNCKNAPPIMCSVEELQQTRKNADN